MNRLFLILVAMYVLPVSGQEINATQEQDFINYLLQYQQYDDAIFELYRIREDSQLSVRARDSLNFLLGWTLYEQKSLDSAQRNLLKVTPESQDYLKAQLFATFALSYMGKYKKADSILSLHTQEKGLTESLVNLMSAGVALLKNNTVAFKHCGDNFSFRYYATAEHERNMLQHAMHQKEIKHKSALIAGLLSTIVPGTGKIYAGRSAEGIAALLQVGILAASSLEHLLKAGITDPQFIGLAVVFSIFYAGNIMGGALSTNRVWNEDSYELQKAILLDMHLALRSTMR